MIVGDQYNLTGNFQFSNIYIKTEVDITGSVLRVFVSSTKNDLDKYRDRVAAALLRGELFPSLSGNWPGGYDETVAKCKSEIDHSHGYLGIFAYWYGSIPAASDISITHMEFRWALAKWGNQKAPPIAIYMPKHRSRLAKRLKKISDGLLSESSEEEKTKHKERLKKFHEEVLNSGRIVKFFTSANDLCERALVTCLRWKGITFENAAKRKDIVVEKQNPNWGDLISPEQLGLLGRVEHVHIIKMLLSKLTGKVDAPGLAILVWGDEQAGQQEFLSHISRIRQLRRGRPPEKGRPALERYDSIALAEWFAEVLGISSGNKSIESIEQLATLLADELNDQQIVVVVDEIHRFAGGLKGFTKTFWKPLYQHLQALKIKQPFRNQLVIVVTDYTGREREWDEFTCDHSLVEEIDLSQLIKLPKLDKFDQSDLRYWLEELEIPDIIPEHIEYLVNIGIKDAEGNIDGTPIMVFDRLLREKL